MNEGRNRAETKPAVALALRRSRAARASWQRRRRRAIAITAISIAALGIPAAWTFDAMTGGAMVEAAVNQVQSLSDLLSQRSPGERTQAELTKLKRAHAAAKILARPKHNAVAANVAPKTGSPSELATLLQSPVAPAGLAPVDLQAPLTPPPSLGTLLASTPGTPSFGSPGSPPITPPGGGGPISYPTSQPREPLVETSAVPEPGTWATMLLGFGLIGWRLRRRRGAACARSLPA